MKYFLFLLIPIVLYSCDNNSNGTDTGQQPTTANDTPEPADTISIKQTEHIFYLPGCPEDSMCTYLSVIKIELGGTATPQLKASVDRYMETSLFSEANTTKSLQAMADSFFADYNSVMGEFDGTLPWAYEVTFDRAAETDSTISFSDSYYSYSGGALGIYGTGYINFKKESGRKINFTDLFDADQITGLTATVEQHFRELHNIAEGQGYDQAGFFIEDDSFYVSKNFLLDSDNISFVYQVYEIAPYVAGEITVTVPIKKLKAYLKPEYAYLVDEVEL